MGVTIADLIAQGLPAIAAINTFLTGVQRREFVGITFRDKAGKEAYMEVELNPTFIGTGKFDVFDADLLNALNNLTNLSDAEIKTVRFISDTTDYTVGGALTGPAETSNIKERGALFFEMETGRQRSFTWPSVRDDLVIPGGNNALYQNAGLLGVDVSALAAEFTGEGLTTRTFMIDNMNPSSLVAAKRITYRSRSKDRRP